MAKVVLAVPEQHLPEVLVVIATGLTMLEGRNIIGEDTRDALQDWVDEHLLYLDEMKESDNDAA